MGYITIITIFTPTYNRAELLPRLYNSLCAQIAKNFVWLVVDDGSTDNTKNLINEWMNKGIIPIRYYFQENQGKSSAHNFGVEKTDTELFVCVDSDDWLLSNATQRIEEIWKAQKQNDNVIGILAKKGKKGDNNIISITHWKDHIEYSTMLDASHKHSLSGDTMLVFKSSIIKKEKFPQYKEEKFVPEAFLYDSLDKYGVMYFCDEILYMCEYQNNGYSALMHKVNAQNPHGYEAYIKQRILLDTTLSSIIKDVIRYDSIKCVLHDGRLINDCNHPVLATLLFPVGYLRYKYLYSKFLKN